MTKRNILVSVLLVFVLALGSTVVMAQDAEVGEITARVIERGELICGVNDRLPGFGTVNDAGEFSGFDVDVCRAVAAAILGDANAVQFRPLTAAERPTALASGEVDMISRNTTWTLSRDSEWGATFGPTTFYDGQGIMVAADSGIAGLEDLEGETICTNAGTTTELNITDTMSALGLEFDLQTFQDFDGALDAFYNGRCGAVTTDASGLISRKAVAPDPGALVILPNIISKEPLGPLSPQSDAQFADVIRWTVYGMINAEEFGINSENVGEFLESEDPGVQRLFGLGETPAGSYLGLDNDFMVNVITQVGNYGEVFDRNLGPETVFGLERGVNALWTDGGLVYAPPFR
jgi:general L-amino acid transport system substrate-binding protein